jgi:heme-degrading monooxygenase HmoA
MILEVAPLTIVPGREAEFEAAFAEASALISAMPGYLGHQLQVCMEQGNNYLLLVQWQRLEDHTEGFRTSPQYQQWKALLHHFYHPFPSVLHYQGVMAQAPGQPLLYPGREQAS